MIRKNLIRTGLDWLDKVLMVIETICLYASVITVVLTVICREIFRISLVWGYEIACWFIIILVFISMPHNLHYDTNLRVSFIYDISPAIAKKVFKVINFVVELGTLILMANGFKIWITKVGKGKLTASGFSNILYYGVIGVGVILSLVELLAEVIDLFVKKNQIEQGNEIKRERNSAYNSLSKKGDLDDEP